jgi:glucokinase-like ROK family protein
MENLRVGNKQLIKDLNRALVIEQIRTKGPMSRTEISKTTKLGLSTVTNIMEDLLSNDVVSEIGEADSTGGRRPILLEFNYMFGYTVGIKIEENQVILALTDLKASVLGKVVQKFPVGDKAENVIPLIAQGIRKLLEKLDLPEDKLLGIGIAVSGLVNKQEGIVIRSSLLGWNQVEIRKELEKEYQVPIYIDNDVNAYALSELWLGYGKKYSNFVCISVGVGIGVAIVIDRKIYYGHFGGAGEYGHTIIQVNGYPCHCGQRGCLEMYASEKFLFKEGEYLLTQFPGSLLEDRHFTFEHVYEAALKRDPLALELLKRIGEYLGIGLVNMINSLNPSTIILVGEGMIAKDYFLPYAKEIAGQNFFAKAEYGTELFVSELGNDAWVIGASLLTINQLFQAPIYEEMNSLVL